MYMKPVIHQS